MTDSATRILVVGPSWVGDMVMSQVLYRSLQATHPGVAIDVLAPAWSGPLLERMPEVRRAIVMPLGHGELGLGQRWRLGHELRSENYDQAIVLPNSLKSALVPFFARISRRTGWRGEMRYGLLNDLRVLDPVVLPLMAQRFLALGQEPSAVLPAILPEPALSVVAGDALETLHRVGLETGRPLLALCPGAEFGAAKCWPAEYYAQVAQEYLSRGWQLALCGSGNDRGICARIRRDSGNHVHCHDLAGRTSLSEVVDLLSLATAVVSNDSGLMHIAAALQRPLLAIYGATSPDFTPPMGVGSVVLQSQLDCAPCFQRECPLDHHRCMRGTSAQFVVDKLDELLLSSGAVP